MSGLFQVFVNSFVDSIHSKARSRRNLHVGAICGPNRLQKRYKKLHGVAKIVFYTGWRCLGWFCGRFGARICSKCRSRRDLYLGRTKKIKKRLNKFKNLKITRFWLFCPDTFHRPEKTSLRGSVQAQPLPSIPHFCDLQQKCQTSQKTNCLAGGKYLGRIARIQ